MPLSSTQAGGRLSPCVWNSKGRTKIDHIITDSKLFIIRDLENLKFRKYLKYEAMGRLSSHTRVVKSKILKNFLTRIVNGEIKNIGWFDESARWIYICQIIWWFLNLALRFYEAGNEIILQDLYSIQIFNTVKFI